MLPPLKLAIALLCIVCLFLQALLLVLLFGVQFNTRTSVQWLRHALFLPHAHTIAAGRFKHNYGHMHKRGRELCAGLPILPSEGAASGTDMHIESNTNLRIDCRMVVHHPPQPTPRVVGKLRAYLRTTILSPPHAHLSYVPRCSSALAPSRRLLTYPIQCLPTILPGPPSKPPTTLLTHLLTHTHAHPLPVHTPRS
jgi:hypothetical protein